MVFYDVDAGVLRSQALQTLPSNGSAGRSDCSILACTSLGAAVQRGHEDTTSRVAASEGEKAAERRRRDRKEQYHKQVWTKAAHGGPYRKCDMGREISAPAELGYEVTASGPTTNFVGNHMTQGAIDLVQMELEEDNAAASYERLKTYCKMYDPPRQLQSLPLLPLEGSPGSGCELAKSAAGTDTREGKCQIRLAEEMVHMEMQLTAHKNPAALRRALIRQRDSKAPRDGLLFDQKQLAETDNYPRTDSASIIEHASEDMQARMERPLYKELSAKLSLIGEPLKQEKIDSAIEKMTYGDYACALQLLQGTYYLPQTLREDNPILAVYFLQRAKCYQQLGMLKKAVGDLSSCIAAGQKAKDSQPTATPPTLLTSLLLRAQIYEQMEQFELSRQDYEEFRQMQPGNQQASRALLRLPAIASR